MLGRAPEIRRAKVNDAPRRPEGAYVLYWMIAQRRTCWNFALQHALQQAAELGRPLLVLEALRIGYRWASARIHQFVIDGMVDNDRRFREAGITYYPYVEPEEGAGRGLLEALAASACLVVTDEFPCFFLPRMVAAAGERLPVRLETVDSNGILPLRATEKEFPTAYAFRRFLQKNLPEHLLSGPVEDPLARAGRVGAARLPRGVRSRWPAASLKGESRSKSLLAKLPIDREPGVVEERGGPVAARDVLRRFVDSRLPRYAEDRNHPDRPGGSGLSPYLHFGHISAHEVLWAALTAEGWTPDRLSLTTSGSREGWWGTSTSTESFLDELVTWREVGYAFTFHRPGDYDRFSSLPSWAQQTLREHAADPRSHIYSRAQFEEARTHDPLWNAAQRQLRREGRLHNYLRMLWGKKILEWSATPQDALDVLIELNNRWALDGRDPNSYSGIFWVLGRFDRAWGPVRPVFGKVRFMSSQNTARKVRLKEYLQRYGPEGSEQSLFPDMPS